MYTDASAFQLGAVISQKGKPIAFYSIRLTCTQQRYKVTEKEPLSIVETLKDFRTILLGQKLGIYTYHKNFRCDFFNTDRVLRWRLILEEWHNTRYSIEQELCMTRLDWVEYLTQSVWNFCRTLKTVFYRIKQCCSEWKQCWRKTMYKYRK